jgi:DNA-binding GntR family transcriptional regulator
MGTMEMLKIESGKTISSQVYDHLRREIVQNHLLPQTRLSEGSLCETFGVSRQPIREVLLRLSGDKLVTIHPQRGTFISPMSLSLFYAAQFIREAVEVEVIARITATSDAALLDALDQELSLQDTFAAHGDSIRFFQSDETFHRIISERCGMPMLWPELLNHKLHLDRVRHLTIVTEAMMAGLIAEHREIWVAIRSRDPALAQDAMRRHLRAALRKVELLRTANPAWFME